MASVRVKHFQIWRSRDGVWRARRRKGKVSVDTRRFPIGSAAFYAECAHIQSAYDKAASDHATPTSATFVHLVRAYLASPYFVAKAPRTKSDYRFIAENILGPIWDDAILDFTPPTIARIRDRVFEKHKRKRANDTVAFLSLLFGRGVELGHATSNPAAGVKKIPRREGAPEANRLWTMAERSIVLLEAPWPIKAPSALGAYLGVRRDETISISRHAIEGDIIDFVT